MGLPVAAQRGDRRLAASDFSPLWRRTTRLRLAVARKILVKVLILCHDRTDRIAWSYSRMDAQMGGECSRLRLGTCRGVPPQRLRRKALLARNRGGQRRTQHRLGGSAGFRRRRRVSFEA